MTRVDGTDVYAHTGHTGVRFADTGTGMYVTVPYDATETAVEFLHEYADEYPSQKRENPVEVARWDLSDDGDVCIAYWNDGLFGLTDDDRHETVTLPQACAGVVEEILLGVGQNTEGDQ